MGEIIKYTDPETGQEQQFEMIDEQRSGAMGRTHIITSRGKIEPVNNGGTPRLSLRLIRKRHTFGDVVFEEKGEVRSAQQGDWYLVEGPDISRWRGYQGESMVEYIILRPVAIEES